MSVPDPWKAAEFYKCVFGMEVIGETDSSLAEGLFLSGVPQFAERRSAAAADMAVRIGNAGQLGVRPLTSALSSQAQGCPGKISVQS
jgi:hypothetical protein